VLCDETDSKVSLAFPPKINYLYNFLNTWQ